MLQVKEISYSYGEVPAVTELSFEAKPSEVLVVLGPNGAGKTTTFELITGLRQCHSGEIRVGDRSVLEAKRSGMLGYAPQTEAIYPGLTVTAQIQQFAAYYGLGARRRHEETERIIALFGLEQLRERRCSTLSGGQRRLVHVAVAAVASPDLLLLDEPTTGVDAEGREVLAAAVRTLAQNGCTVVVSTHQYGDADRMADRLAVFERGQVVAIVPISVAQSTASLVELGGLAGAEVSDLRAVFEQAGRRTQSKFTYWTIPSEVTAVGMVSGIVDLIGREPGWRVLPPGIEAYLATHGERS